jgi:hypothetical protein
MAIETVRIAIVNSDVVPAFLDGVSVRVFDADGLFVTMAVSGATEPGVAEFELPGGATPLEYQLRFYLPRVAIVPKRIQVFSPASLSPTATNDFIVAAEVFALEPSPDPMMCRASGVVLGPTGRPKKAISLSFSPRFNAFVSGENASLTGRFTVRSDANGFVVVDLYRFGQYDVTIEGREAVIRPIEVPNRSTVLLSHLLFPVVASVTYEQTQPFSVAKGSSLSLKPHVTASDFRDLGLGLEDVLYEVLDPSIATVQILGDHVVVHGLAAGTTTLRVTRTDNSVVYLPDLGITGGDVPISVVP